MREDNTERPESVLAEEQRDVPAQSALIWTECEFFGCTTRCVGARCRDHQLGDGKGVGQEIVSDPPPGVGTGQPDPVPDDLFDDETEITAVLHRVDDLRIVRVDGLVSTYQIEERRDGTWETEAELTREQVLLVAGMVNKRWGED